MNNAKVRIYELSKELNLENKDILDICEQLNIAVKSHSSTITESQVERIKASAEKYVASHAQGKPVSRPVTEANRGQITGQAKGERKQEILAIHHKQIRPNGADTETTPMLATPPKLQSSALPIKPSATDGIEGESLLEDTQSRTAQKLEETVTNTAKLQAPQLVKPGSRTSQDAPIGRGERQPMPKPVQPGESSTTSERANREPLSKKSPDKLRGTIELQRPKPPKSASQKSSDLDDLGDDVELAVIGEAGEEDPLDLALKQKPKLKRPIPAHQQKRTKWEEEEEEEREKEAQNKAAKAAGKNKRRTLLLDEEDDDLDGELNSALVPTSVSLSIARPPKPQDQMKQSASVTTTAKPKKAPVKSDGSTTSRGKTERRDRKEVQQRPESITLSGNLTVRDLAELLKIPETEIIRNLFLKGIPVNVTQTLDLDTARLVAEELEVKVEIAQEIAAATKSIEMLNAADMDNLHRRPPVVTIMGHVDHGKTTLLDSIRKTKVAQGEAGGITQHIGAYHVDVEHEGKPSQIVFLDTPGHEAFTAMRARGARVTDIAILVVAADDGVQPQTREAISHARAAGVPIVVAINKVDKIEANADRIKQELSDMSLVPEEWGGDTIMVPVSALKGENLDNLLEMILLVSEMEELSANPDRAAKGTVIEANLDRTRGPVATLLVQNGTLRVGDIIVAGAVHGKIRAMIDDRGQKVEAATPSFAVEVLGLNDVPAAGDEFDVFEGEREARLLAEQRADVRHQSRLQQAMSSRRVTLTSLSAQAQEGELKDLNLVIKADVQGSLEAILGALQQLPQNEVQIRVLLSAPGEVTETDVDLAAASGAVIVGFNTTLATGARQAADREGVDIREYDIIYKLLDDIQGAMEGLLDPEEIESSLGQAEVRMVFPVGRGAVAGCYVLSGKVVRNRLVRVRRNGSVIYEGTLDSLRRMKEDAREVNAGYECGISIAKFSDWKEGDIIEAYEMTMKRRTLSAN